MVATMMSSVMVGGASCAHSLKAERPAAKTIENFRPTGEESPEKSCRLVRLYHCPPGGEECNEVGLGDDGSRQSDAAQLLQVFHCPPSADECVELDVTKPHLDPPPPPAPQPQSCNLVRVFHCPPGEEQCLEVNLGPAPAESSDRELLQVFTCPPAAEECREIDLGSRCRPDK